ncbi:hypothetical protein, partial [Nocardioides stalactiti]|uniref:hypothetical protein n=1 Tax=Nocardioides stalactiti TaxID=2755356 RepID=UPI0015FF4707
ASSTGPTAADDDDDEPITAAAGIYFVSDTSNGPRLFREFQAVTPSSDPAVKVLVALRRLTADVGPVDPDYETLWPADSFESVRVEDGRVVVVLGTDRALAPTPVEAEGRYGVQQAVYTAEAAISQTLPVSFEYDGRVARWVLGTRVGAVVDRDRSYDLTAPVNITDPAENLAVDTGVLLANGTQADNVRRVDWSLTQNGVVVRSGRAVPTDITGPDARATLGAPGWETGPIDLSGLPPGSYVFRVTTTVEGQTSDRPSEFSDTRTITVR